MKKIISCILLSSLLTMNTPAIFAKDIDKNTQTTVQTTAVENNKSLEAQCETQAQVEHLAKQKNKYLDTVKIVDGKAIITQGNVIKIKFAQAFNSKTAKVGDEVVFIFEKDLLTKEGTKLFPAGTKLIGKVQCVEPPKWWNKNAQVMLSLGDIILPNGAGGKLSARVYSKDSTLKKSGWATFGKVAGYTVGLFGVGAGIGAAIGAAADAVGVGCLAIGMPVGAGVGLILGTVTPGQHYKAKPGKTIKIQLTQDLEISLDQIH